MANTAIVALSKNTGINPAIITTGLFNSISVIIARNCPAAPNKSPIVTAFAEPNPKVAAQSIPGTAPGKSLVEIP